MATLYFNNAVDGEWTEQGNWWTNAGLTTQASALPTSADSVIAVGNIDTNSGSEPTVVNFTMDDPGEEYVYNILSVSVTVTGTATFNGSSSLFLGTVTGDATFNDTAYNGNGTVSGNATFNDSSYNGGDVEGDAVFNGYAFNAVMVFGDATFNDSTYNDGTVVGNATLRDSSYATVSGSITMGSATYTNRTPYPIPRGLNGSSILGVI